MHLTLIERAGSHTTRCKTARVGAQRVDLLCRFVATTADVFITLLDRVVTRGVNAVRVRGFGRRSSTQQVFSTGKFFDPNYKSHRLRTSVDSPMIELLSGVTGGKPLNERRSSQPSSPRTGVSSIARSKASITWSSVMSRIESKSRASRVLRCQWVRLGEDQRFVITPFE